MLKGETQSEAFKTLDIDNFQGEESDLIVLLVWSDPTKRAE